MAYIHTKSVKCSKNLTLTQNKTEEPTNKTEKLNLQEEQEMAKGFKALLLTVS